MELTAPPLYVDSNVLIVAFEHNTPLGSRLRKLFMPRPKAQSPALTTSELSMAECMVHPFRNRDARLINHYDFWFTEGGAELLNVVPVNWVVLQVSAIVRARYQELKLPDAIHISSAIGAGAKLLLTGDRRIRGSYTATYQWPPMTGMTAITTEPIRVFDIGGSDWSEVEELLEQA